MGKRGARLLRVALVGLGIFYDLVVCAGESVSTVCLFPREREPAGLSALSHVSGDRYLSVDDRGGWLCELAIPLSATGGVLSCSVVRRVRLAGRVDLEGCAYDPLDKRVWVSDEADSSIREFDLTTGVETAAAPVPEAFRQARANRSIEGLALSPDGLKMYAANEDTLLCDGAPASDKRGGVVRIQEFVRAGKGAAWTLGRAFRYRTHRLRGRPSAGHEISGIAALCADGPDSLLVLEREFSKKNFPVPTFHARLARVKLPPEGGPLKPHVLWDAPTGFSNYEGLSLGPILPDGSRPILLLTDAGNSCDANLRILTPLRARGKCGIMCGVLERWPSG